MVSFCFGSIGAPTMSTAATLLHLKWPSVLRLPRICTTMDIDIFCRYSADGLKSMKPSSLCSVRQGAYCMCCMDVISMMRIHILQPFSVRLAPDGCSLVYFHHRGNNVCLGTTFVRALACPDIVPVVDFVLLTRHEEPQKHVRIFILAISLLFSFLGFGSSPCHDELR